MRFYNESLNGGNIVEEKSLLDQVLTHPGQTKVALLVVHPYLTSSHHFETVRLTSREEWGALGSLHLLKAYKNAIKIRLGIEQQSFDASGTNDFGNTPRKLNKTLQRMFQQGKDFQVDPIAFEKYREAIAELHEHKIRIVFVVPPTAENLLAPKREAFQKYTQSLLSESSSRDKVLDFSSDEFAEFRRVNSNFLDGVHLNSGAAEKLTAIIDDRLKFWFADAWIEHR